MYVSAVSRSPKRIEAAKHAHTEIGDGVQHTSTSTHSGIHNESACHTQSIICKDPPPRCYGNSRNRRERWPVAEGGGPRKGDSRDGGPGDGV